MVRIATFNVENLFDRPKAMNFDAWADGQKAIDAASALNVLFGEATYSAADKKKMLDLLATWDLLATRPNSEFLELRKIRGQLFTVPREGEATIVAKGRADWVGWIDLKKRAIEDEAIENTARVITEVDPDVIALVEVENRPSLQRFYDGFVASQQRDKGQAPHRYNMVIDGNDERGIDVGILSRYPISSMRSHIDDLSGTSRTFSRDCPEYEVTLPSGETLVVIPNHFASKGSDVSGKRRKVQSKAVKKIYERVRETHRLVVVAGDLNDFPAGGSLGPLLDETDLVDAMALPKYQGLPGTYKRGTAREKLDYLLLSPELVKRVKKVDVFRKGYYAPTKWKSFPNIDATTKSRFQASDHHCVWADIDLG